MPERVIFKSYDPNQQYLLPPSLAELIEKNHPVRIVNSIIEKIDLKPLLQKYKGGGTSSFHPKMLLKVLVYAYLNNIYSSRKMEQSLKENIHFMWLSGMNKPDHNTINRFRSERLKEVLKQIFVQVVELMTANGLVSLKEVYLDGTKLEANANRYSFVWGKAIETSKKRMGEQLDELWKHVEELTEKEITDKDEIDFETVDPKEIEKVADRINEQIKGRLDPLSRKVRQKLNYVKKKWPAQLERYRVQEKILGKRNSFSKTDTDSTFMQMKEDHMRNRDMKPGYNLQISTNNQCIINYSLHQNSSDTNTLESHIREFKQLYKKLPKELTADAAYGSCKNYEIMESLKIKPYVKYFSFARETRSNQDIFDGNNFEYDASRDIYKCPEGRKLLNTGVYRRERRGIVEEVTKYRSENCKRCKFKELCINDIKYTEKIIFVNKKLKRYKQIARENLESKKGLMHRQRRYTDVETVFANIKHNKKFRRFNLRGLEKVETEMGLIALTHNIAKIAS